MKAKEELIKEAIERGIKPGAVIKTASGNDYTQEVRPIETWDLSATGSLWNGPFVSRSICLYDGQTGRWATVITPAPEDQPQGLVDGMACEPDEHMRAAIVAKSVEIGSSSGKCPIWGKYLYWDAQEYKLLQGDDTPSKPIPPGEFYDRLCKTVKPEPPIRIGSHDVKFGRGEITVGCTTVPNDIVRNVAERLKD